MELIDFHLVYRHVTRTLLIMKSPCITNTMLVPQLDQLSLRFPLLRVLTLSDRQSYNYLYLFKFFFGRRGFLIKLKSYFSLGK